MRNIGPCQNPFGSLLLILFTLDKVILVIDEVVGHKHTAEIALELERWLESRDEVLWVSYRGFEYHENAENICGMDLGVFLLLVLKVMLMLEPLSLMLYDLQVI
ncbi:uncharacterized protein OCT59_006068 [Rhizophagus irregularis]|uniref:uncharacterized protein n=1 Tax=Rhizophagus irregularis TaxID=588596 RepID=UPI0033270579|nr:hypothetical protein OCT59_006068 [Rhizophagus irregularis]